MVYIPGSKVIMGSTQEQIQESLPVRSGAKTSEFQNELPHHRVKVKPFFIDRHEVKMAEYRYGRYSYKVNFMPLIQLLHLIFHSGL